LGELNNSDLLHRHVNSAVMTLCRCSGPSQSKAQSTVQHPSARRRPEITLFKGLGEVSPKEFAQFIGNAILLRQETLRRQEQGAQKKS